VTSPSTIVCPTHITVKRVPYVHNRMYFTIHNNQNDRPLTMVYDSPIPSPIWTLSILYKFSKEYDVSEAQLAFETFCF